MFSRTPALVAAASLLLALVGCQERETQRTEPQTQQPAPQAEPRAQVETGAAGQAEQPMEAVANLQPTEGHNVSGVVTFTRVAEGVEIVAEVQGLAPGKYGFHVHEKGDCSAPDASSAGEHYNPEGTPHGAPDNPPAQRHAGDLGNIEASAEGAANFRRVDQVISLEGPQSIIGRTVLVHAGEDDLTSQLSGDSGPRVACGVIEPKSR